MTKKCKKCGHKKGDHKFYSVSNIEGLFSCCWNKKENEDICGCEDYRE